MTFLMVVFHTHLFTFNLLFDQHVKYFLTYFIFLLRVCCHAEETNQSVKVAKRELANVGNKQQYDQLKCTMIV